MTDAAEPGMKGESDTTGDPDTAPENAPQGPPTAPTGAQTPPSALPTPRTGTPVPPSPGQPLPALPPLPPLPPRPAGAPPTISAEADRARRLGRLTLITGLSGLLSPVAFFSGTAGLRLANRTGGAGQLGAVTGLMAATAWTATGVVLLVMTLVGHERPAVQEVPALSAGTALSAPVATGSATGATGGSPSASSISLTGAGSPAATVSPTGTDPATVPSTGDTAGATLPPPPISDGGAAPSTTTGAAVDELAAGRGDCLVRRSPDADGHRFFAAACSGPHDYQVGATFTPFDTTDYPGAEALRSAGSSECPTRAAQHLRAGADTAGLLVSTLIPAETDWRRGNTSIKCLIFRADGTPLTASLVRTGG